jgi:hypothetical protein
VLQPLALNQIVSLAIRRPGIRLHGPELAKRMHKAFTAAGGKAEFHMLPPFGSDGHFLIGSPDGIALWAPLVSKFLDEHP